MKQLILAFLLIVIVLEISAETPEEIENFDQKVYNPLKVGLKDLVVKVEISNLDKIIQDRIPTAQIGMIYFLMYWVAPGKVDVNVSGLPNGFSGLREELKQIILGRVGLIFPREIMKIMSPYTFTKKQIGGREVLRGVDKTNRLPVNTVKLEFNDNGSLAILEMSSPRKLDTVSFNYGFKSWSRNSFVLKTMKTKNVIGTKEAISNVTINYKNISGYGLPEKISIQNKYKSVVNGKESKREDKKIVISFSTYRLNEGEAEKYFKRNKK